jgi:hypothetical protein
VKVTIKLGEPVWRAIGQRKVEIEAPGADCSLLELMDRLTAAYPPLRDELRSEGSAGGTAGIDWHFTLFLQDRRVKPADLGRERIGDGEEVMIVLPMAGG